MYLWHFSQHRKNGTEIFSIDLPNFSQDFQKYIDDGTLIPGWHSEKSYLLAGSTRHESATSLKSFLPPDPILKALHKNNPGRSFWHDSYKEEYDGLYDNETFDIISEDEYQCSRKAHGICAIPSMCVFTVKNTNGIPTRAKSRIVVLGNLEQHSWTKSDCFSPVVSIPMIHLLTALAVHNGCTIKQADFKFAFIQATSCMMN
jgi:hypothetical protein